jgi:hypothetical protein
MRSKFFAVAGAMALALAAPAHAGVYHLKFSAGGDSGVMNFTTAGSGTSLITGVTGEIDGSPITGLSAYFGADNTLSSAYPYFTAFDGVSVTTAKDTYNFASGTVLFFDKASTDPTQFIYIPGSELTTGDVVAVSGKTNTYQLAFGTANADGAKGADSGVVDFTTAGSLSSAIIGVSGQIDGSPITGLSSYFGADNILYADYPHVSLYDGVSVSTSQDTYNFAGGVGIFFDKASTDPTQFIYIPGSELAATSLQLITAVPEPETWAMFIVGLAGVGATLRRRGAIVAGITNYGDRALAS